MGKVAISSGTQLAYTGQQTTTVTTVWSRQLTLGYSGTSVDNAGSLSANFSGNGNNRYVFGYLPFPRKEL